MRLFEAMQAGRCPVILSDDWLAPPFIDWSSCSIQVPEARVRELPGILRARSDDADRLGRAAREVWEEYFSPERQLPTLIRAAAETPVVTRDRLVDLAAALLHEETARSAYRWTRKRVRRALGFARP